MDYYSQGSSKAILDLINSSNGTQFKLSELEFSGLKALGGNTTEIDVASLPGDAYKGMIVLRYNRHDLHEVTVNKLSDVRFFPTYEKSIVTVVADAIGFALEEWELQIAAGSQVISTQINTLNIIRVTANPNCMVLKGETSLALIFTLLDGHEGWLIGLSDAQHGYGVISSDALKMEDMSSVLTEDGAVLLGE